jgi:hypothetical protein
MITNGYFRFIEFFVYNIYDTEMEDSMKFISSIVAVVILAVSAVGQQTDKTFFFSSGNQFLRFCDEQSSFRMAEPAESNQLWNAMCTAWFVGIWQGVQVEDQLCPKPQQKLDRNACVPDNVTNDQMRLVAVKYMKDHPGNLELDASMLAIAAIKIEWPCRLGEVR